MAKNIKIVPNPTGSTPYILFSNSSGDEIKMHVHDDGSLVFSGKTQGDEMVKIDADTLNFHVKGDVDFEDNINFKGEKGTDSSGDWIGSDERIKGQKGEKGSKGIKGEKGLKGTKGTKGIKGVLGSVGENVKGQKGDKGEDGFGGSCPPPPTTFTWFYEDCIPGWDPTASDNVIEIWNTGFMSVPAYDGDYFCEINSRVSQRHALQQTVTVDSGQEYELSFAHRGRSSGGPFPNIMNVKIQGGSTNINVGTFTGITSAWTVNTHTFTPTDSSLVLTFSSTTASDGGNFLDAVELTKTSDGTDVMVNGSFEEFQTGNVGEKGTKGTKGDKGSTPTLITTDMVLHLDATNPSSYGGYRYTME